MIGTSYRNATLIGTQLLLGNYLLKKAYVRAPCQDTAEIGTVTVVAAEGLDTVAVVENTVVAAAVVMAAGVMAEAAA